MPPLGAQENIADPVAHVKYFTPDSSWTWYATEGEPEGADFLFFGYVVGIEHEWGHFRLSELESIRGHYGLAVERDVWFTPKAVSELAAEVDRHEAGA